MRRSSGAILLSTAAILTALSGYASAGPRTEPPGEMRAPGAASSAGQALERTAAASAPADQTDHPGGEASEGSPADRSVLASADDPPLTRVRPGKQRGQAAEPAASASNALAASRKPVGTLVLQVRSHARLALHERPGGDVVATIGERTEFGSRSVMPVVRRADGWLGVKTSASRKTLWVRPGDRVVYARVRVTIEVDLSTRQLILYRLEGGSSEDDSVKRVKLMQATVGVGAPSSPTPIGVYAVTDKLSGSRYSSSAYGCCILALSGRQPKPPPGWTGGDRLAIHGTGAPSTIGAAASAGCLRVADGDLRQMLELVPLGTLVTVRA